MSTCLSKHLLLSCLLLPTAIVSTSTNHALNSPLDAGTSDYTSACIIEETSIDGVNILRPSNGLLPCTNWSSVNYLYGVRDEKIDKELHRKGISAYPRKDAFFSPCGGFIAFPRYRFIYDVANKKKIEFAGQSYSAALEKIYWGPPSLDGGISLAILLSNSFPKASLFLHTIERFPPSFVQSFMRSHFLAQKNERVYLPKGIAQRVVLFLPTYMPKTSMKEFALPNVMRSICWRSTDLLLGVDTNLYALDTHVQQLTLGKPLNVDPLPIRVTFLCSVGGPWLFLGTQCSAHLFNDETKKVCLLDKEEVVAVAPVNLADNEEGSAYALVWVSRFLKQSYVKLCKIHDGKPNPQTIKSFHGNLLSPDIEIAHVEAPDGKKAVVLTYKDDKGQRHFYKITLDTK